MQRFHYNLKLAVMLYLTLGIIIGAGHVQDFALQLEYSTYLGGNGTEGHGLLFFNSKGNLIVVSETSSTNYPLINPIQDDNNGERDIIITEFDMETTEIIFSTYVGGDGDDFVSGATMGSNGNIIIVGVTDSTDFPLVNPLFENKSTPREVFVVVFDSDTSLIIMSSYLGEASDYYAIGATTDINDNIIISGATDSKSFPGTNVSYNYQNVSRGGAEGFITKLSPNGTEILFSTYIGGTSDDSIKSVTTDSQNNILIIGTTKSSDFPLVNASLTQKSGSEWDVFISKLSPDGNSLNFSTYHGGTRVWGMARILCDGDDNVIITGETNSNDFPLVNSYQPNFGGGVYDVFISKFDMSSLNLEFSTFIGGVGDETPISLVINFNGDLYISGCTNSRGFPIQNSYQPAKSGGWDGFVISLANTGQMCKFSTFFGGSYNDYISDLVFLSEDDSNFLISGHTSSRNVPMVTPFQENYGGGEFDLFFSQFSWEEVIPTTNDSSTEDTTTLQTTLYTTNTEATNSGMPLALILFVFTLLVLDRQRIRRK